MEIFRLDVGMRKKLRRKVHKSSDLKTFYKLTKKRQKAVILLFDNKKTINEIVEELNITDLLS